MPLIASDELLIIVILLIFAFLFAIWSTFHIWMVLVSKQWPSIEGVITSYSILVKGDFAEYSPPFYQPYLHISYTLENGTFKLKKNTKERYYANLQSKDLVNLAIQKIYPLGTKIKVYYYPKYPKIAVLEPEVLTWSIRLAPTLALLIFLFGITLLII